MMPIYSILQKILKEKQAGFLALIDPDSRDVEDNVQLAVNCEEGGVDALLVGGSFLLTPTFSKTVQEIKKKVTIPVILFPGDATQITEHADAVLFLSLISGRNPEFLIGNQVKAAPLIKEYKLETIPTAYMLIESGSQTSVQFMSNTTPLPRNKIGIAMAHALSAEYLGMKLVYLEGGSGAENTVPNKMIQKISSYISLPIIVGGGIKTPAIAQEKIKHGASFVVIGNAFETQNAVEFLKEYAKVVHQ